MSLHDDYLKLRGELNKIETELSETGPNGFNITITPRGIRLETRTPSGISDIVHTIFIDIIQARFLVAYIQRVIEMPDEKIEKIRKMMNND